MAQDMEIKIEEGLGTGTETSEEVTEQIEDMEVQEDLRVEIRIFLDKKNGIIGGINPLKEEKSRKIGEINLL